MSFRKVETNFTGGAIGPLLAGRSNLQAYQDGMSEIVNFRVMPQGGLRRRPGSNYCAVLSNIPYQDADYVFNAQQTYLLLFSTSRVDIFDGIDGHLIQTIIGCPWTSPMIGHMSVYSGGDYIFICHPDMPQQQLQRISATTFVQSAFSYEQQTSGAATPVFQPYYKYEFPSTTLTIQQISGYSDATGYVAGATVSLKSSVPMFQTGHVGAYFQIGTGQVEITGVTDPSNALGTVRTTNLRVHLALDAFSGGNGDTDLKLFMPFHKFVAGQTLTISMGVGFANLTAAAVNGTWTVTSSDANSLSYVTGQTLNQAGVGGGVDTFFWAGLFTTPDWAEPMYSAVHGYPNCGGFHQKRHILGGGRDATDRLNFSQNEAPFNFDVGTGLDNESIQVPVSFDRVPIIRHLLSVRHLQIFTSEGEFYAPFGIGFAPLTPASASIINQTTYGTPDTIKPCVFDGATLLVTKTLSSVRELLFNNNDTGYSTPNVSFQAEQLLNQPTGMTVLLEDSEQQEATAYICNADGTLAVYAFARKEAVAAWAQWTTNGLYKNVRAVDRVLFTIVQRTINGVMTTFLERVDHDAMLDCQLSASGASATHWTGFGHLASQSADVVVDGTGALGPVTVAVDGSVTLNSAATSIAVGLNFIPTTLSLPPEMNLPDGPSMGQPRRVVRAVLQVDQSVSAQVRGKNFVLRTAREDLTKPPVPFTGQMEFYLMGWDRQGQVRISCPDPVPFTMLGLTTEIEF